MTGKLRLSAFFGSDRGSALIELAVTLPLLVLLLVGAADFARVFYVSMALTNAARAGAQYGSQNNRYADTTNMKTTAESASGTVPMTATPPPSYFCQCATDTGGYTAISCSATCAGHLAIYVTVNTTSTFNTITQFPGIPHTLTMNRSATLRAQ
jgi:Flp pilus assembly protein TadG